MAGPLTAQQRISRWYGWMAVAMLWWVCFFNYADRQAMSSLLPLLQRNFGFDAVELGWIGSAFAWVYAAMAPVAGLAADRFSRKALILTACIVWSFFTLATSWCGGFAALVAIRALTGLGEAFYFPAAMSLISDYHGARTRSRAMAWHQSAVYAGTILGSWVAATLAERFGWRVPFYFFGPAGILLALMLGRWLRETKRGAAEEVSLERGSVGAWEKTPAGADHRAAAWERLSVAETARHLTHSPAALLLMAGFLCANFVAVIFLTWTPQFLVEKFHSSIGAAGLTGTLYIHLASALAVPLAGGLADRLRRRRPTGRMAVQAGGLIAGSLFVFLIGYTSSQATLLLAMTVFGACKGFYDSGIFASLYDTIEPRARGAAAGLMNTVGWAGGALGPLFVGIATKYGHQSSKIENMSRAISSGAIIYLAGAACVLLAMAFTASAGSKIQKVP